MENQLSQLLERWDPFKIGKGNYETEVAEVTSAVYEHDDEDALAKEIKRIYEFAFGEVLRMEDCRSVASQLLVIKNSGSCSV